jgi:mRNA interferase RelE/StbE
LENVLFSKQAKKYLLSQDNNTQNRINAGISGLQEKPPKGDIVKLSGMEDQYRLRIGGYRILYHFEDKFLKIDLILPRGDAYKS